MDRWSIRNGTLEEARANVRELTRQISHEFWKMLGLDPKTKLKPLLRPILELPSRRFSQVAATFDQLVADAGFSEALHWVTPQFITNLHVAGQERLPDDGPLLVASNHPGGADALAIASSLPRPDLKIVVSAIPFITALPNAAKHLIYTTLDPFERMRAVRESIRHLKAGGALLIFPSGMVDPDPAHLPGALAALSGWSASIGVIVKAVPQTKIVTTIVSGVLAPSSLRNPLIRIRSNARDRQKLAEALQVIQQMLFPRRLAVATHVDFGAPFSSTIVAAGARERTQEIIERAKHQLFDHLDRLGLPLR